MAWIESHQTLVHHPKILKLRQATGWSLNESIGTIHRLWWWTLAYAESGYLGDHEPATISMAIEAQETDNYSHELLFDVLKTCRFMTKNNFIHDWLDYAGRYLKTKYRTSQPEKLRDITENFDNKKGKPKSSNSRTKVSTKSDTLTNLPLPTNKPKELSSEAYRLADLLLEKILERLPNYRELQKDKKEKTRERWAEDIDKAIRLDNRHPEELREIITWSQDDSFWKANILSGSKLRSQYDKLIASKDRAKAPEQKKYDPTGGW